MERFIKKIHGGMEIFWPALIVMLAFILIMAKPKNQELKKQVTKERAGYPSAQMHETF